MTEPLQVFEHGKLHVGGAGLSGRDVERLQGLNERHGCRFFDFGYRCVRFTQYVGVVQIGRRVIEILPKVDGVPGADNRRLWHGVLVDMLRRCGLLRIEAPSAADLASRRALLLNLYLEAFLREVDALVHHGLAKRYRKARANLGVFKGRLLVAQQLRHNLVHRERAFCEYMTYDRDNVFNRVLKEALGVVRDMAIPARLADDARRLLLAFDGLPEAAATAETFQRLRYDRHTERYRRATVLAEMILLNYAPDIRHGDRSVLAILFDMNVLFEHYVLCELQRAARELGGERLRVTGQTSRPFWRAGSTQAMIRPDILVELGSAKPPLRVILDTKWKLPKSSRPTDADLQQMYAYGLQFGATASALLYPQTGAARDTEGYFLAACGLDSKAEHGCGMWFVDILKEGKLDPGLGRRLAGRLLMLEADRVRQLPAGPAKMCPREVRSTT
jgi:5-methylcytosine-specific restriction enzyme subunit McrC